jgi:hypothetical protein
MEHEITLKGSDALELRAYWLLVSVSFGFRVCSLRGGRTMRILNSSVEGTAGPEIVRIMHKKAIYFLVCDMRHHEQTQVIPQLSCRAIRG